MRKSLILAALVIGVFLIAGKMNMADEENQENEKQEEKQLKHEGGQHRFDDVQKWVQRFENTGRDEWQKPDAVIKAIDLADNTVIADIGSATGYFPVRFAKKIPKGRVYGIDLEEGMVKYLNGRAKREGLPNLKSILGEPDDPKIPEPVDIVFICNTYHHINERVDYFTRLKENFKPGGRLVIVDFVKGDLPVGPPDHMKLAASQVISELAGAGYSLTQRSETLPYQYLLLFKLSK